MKVNLWSYRTELAAIFTVGGASGLILSVADCAKPWQRYAGCAFVIVEIVIAFSQRIEYAVALSRLRRHYDFNDWQQRIKSPDEQQRTYARSAVERHLRSFGAETIAGVLKHLESR